MGSELALQYSSQPEISRPERGHHLASDEMTAKNPLSLEAPPMHSQRMRQDSYPIPDSARSLYPVSITPISKDKSSSTAAEHNQGCDDDDNDDDDDYDDNVEILLPPPPSSSTHPTPSSSAHPTSKRKAEVISPVSPPQDPAILKGQEPRRRKTIGEVPE